MRYVIQVKVGSDWVDYEDRWGEGREYDDAATAGNWIEGARNLPGAPEYRLFDREAKPEEPKEPPRTAPEAVLAILEEHGPQTDVEIVTLIRLSDWIVCDLTEQTIRTARNRMLKRGLIRETGDRRTTRKGKTSAVWEIANAAKHGSLDRPLHEMPT